MRGQALTRSRWSTVAVVGASCVGGAVAGAGTAVAPPQLSVAAILALTIVLAVALHPPMAAYLLLATTPLLAGLDRGLVLPLLRPHEAVGGLVAIGLVVHLVVRGAAGAPVRLRTSFGRLDAAIVTLAIAGSVVPLVVMTVRERAIEQDDLLYALQVWKYYGLFVIVRSCITSPAEVRNCLSIAMASASAVSLIAILQVLHAPGVESLLSRLYVPETSTGPSTDRGSSTLASSIAVADVMTYALAIASGLLLTGERRKWLLGMLAVLFVFGVVAAGQFSGFIGVVVGMLAFGWITGRLSRTMIAFVPIAGLAALLLRPVIENRLSGFDGGRTLPASWQVRLDNVTSYFWPVLESDWNWVTGVRPLARIDGPPFSGIDFIWIESGHIYLLWTGGLAFLLAFFWYLWVALRTVGRIARKRADPIGVAATASFVALSVTAVLMVLDPHLTLRGSADLSFALLGLAMVRSVR